MIEIRDLRRNDIDTTIDIHRQSIYSTCKDYYTENEIKAWTDYLTPEICDEGIRDKNNISIVATDKNKVIGYGILNLADKELKALYLLPRYKNQGVAKKILMRLEVVACKKNVGKISLRSTINAVGFYQRLGYAKIENVKYTINDEVALDCVYMEKELRE